MRRRTALGLASMLAMALATAAAPPLHAQGRTAEYQIKAAFLYKFGAYVEWPAQTFERADAPVVIGVAGPQLVLEEVSRTAAGRSINGRAVAVRRLRAGDTVEGVHILFIADAEASGLAHFLTQAKGQAVLTVTEAPDGAASAGVINFVVVDDKVRFDVALQQAEANNLKISARLLSVAHRVSGRPS